MKLSKWKSKNKNPELIGWYECRNTLPDQKTSLTEDENGKIFRHWNGHNWEWIATKDFPTETPPIKQGDLTEAKLNKNTQWRGIKNPIHQDTLDLVATWYEIKGFKIYGIKETADAIRTLNITP